jgi:hypothetical protein
MPYVGNSPAANFASVTKDSFSGDGSTTAFTLSKAATTNGVAVFVENVRQEPTTAYAVSGTTLTFTAAPVSASGNNIYVLHHNSPASTATHPSAQALTATSGTFSAGVSGTTGTFTGAFTSLGIDDNGTETAIEITSDEAVGIGKSLTPNDFSGYQVLTVGGSAATTGAGLDLEDSSGNIDARFFGDGNGVQIASDPSNATGSSNIRFEIDGDSAFKMHNLGSFLTAKLEAQGGVAIADDASVTFRAAPGIIVVSNRTNGSSAAYHVDYINSSPTELSDPNSDFRNDDTDGSICVIKSSNDYDITIKNRAGASKAITVAAFSTDF